MCYLDQAVPECEALSLLIFWLYKLIMLPPNWPNFREEVKALVDWCNLNKSNLILTVNKTREVTVDFKKS